MALLKKKDRFIFNTHTLSYEKAVVSWGNRAFRFLSFVVAALVFSIIISTIYYRFIDSPKDKILKGEVNEMQNQYYILNQEVDRLTGILDELHYRDGNVYRVLFEADPISNDVWQAGSGGINKYRSLEKYDNGELMKNIAMKVDKLKKRMVIQSKSYDEIAEMISNKQQMLAAIPSIQPVLNKKLLRMASGYGWRVDPIYKTQEFHKGMDFTCPIGTNVYVTGDGVVEEVNYSFSGYGNQIIVNHGYGYKTRYAHLSKPDVHIGQKVKRGEVIAQSGSTGKSTGPHVHYEVIKNGDVVNPVYFYYNDLKDADLQKMVEMSNTLGQTLD